MLLLDHEASTQNVFPTKLQRRTRSPMMRQRNALEVLILLCHLIVPDLASPTSDMSKFLPLRVDVEYTTALFIIFRSSAL